MQGPQLTCPFRGAQAPVTAAAGALASGPVGVGTAHRGPFSAPAGVRALRSPIFRHQGPVPRRVCDARRSAAGLGAVTTDDAALAACCAARLLAGRGRHRSQRGDNDQRLQGVQKTVVPGAEAPCASAGRADGDRAGACGRGCGGRGGADTPLPPPAGLAASEPPGPPGGHPPSPPVCSFPSVSCVCVLTPRWRRSPRQCVV